jgi:two-component system sensor histidine kinase AlgZ
MWRKSPLDTDDFFLPNLCTMQAVFFIVLLTQLMVFVLVLAQTSLALIWQDLALTTLFAQWVVLLSAAILCQLRPWLKQRPLTVVFIICYCVILTITVLVQMVGTWALNISGLVYITGTLTWWDRLREVLISAIITAVVLRFFFLQHEIVKQRQAELNSRLQALQSRIRPHFLFNSMNSIASLIATNPQVAEEAIEDLSELFRANLDSVETQIPLSEELDLCRRYLHIEGLRLGKRLTINWQMAELPNWIKVPILTIQPLLENAIYHGIQPLTAGGVVDIKVWYDAPFVQVEVRNPFAEQARQRTTGHGMALGNIRARLDALYGSQAELDTEVKHGHYITRLRYPFIKQLVLKDEK